MSLFVFLSLLSVGIALSIPLVRLGRVGRSFYLFSEGMALTLIGIATTLRTLTGGGAQIGRPEGIGLALYVGFAAALAMLIGLELVDRFTLPARTITALVGIAALLWDATQLHAASTSIPGAAWLHPLNALLCAWLVGSFLIAMTLGHYYLVMPGASIAPLMVAFKFSALGLAARMLLGIAVLGLWWQARAPGPLEPSALFDTGVFVTMRVLFGLVLPASLGYFTWKTIQMRSTQSATGILYVVVFLTMVGEALSVYLSLSTRLPI